MVQSLRRFQNLQNIVSQQFHEDFMKNIQSWKLSWKSTKTRLSQPMFHNHIQSCLSAEPFGLQICDGIIAATCNQSAQVGSQNAPCHRHEMLQQFPNDDLKERLQDPLRMWPYLDAFSTLLLQQCTSNAGFCGDLYFRVSTCRLCHIAPCKCRRSVN